MSDNLRTLIVVPTCLCRQPYQGDRCAGLCATPANGNSPDRVPAHAVRCPCYGTILLDLVSRRVVDLLPDRSAASVPAWLDRHSTITLVCCDRNNLYADGIREGAAKPVQVVDRFHLVHNLRA